MRIKIFLLLIASLCSLQIKAQSGDRLNIYIDCSNTWCDDDYLVSNITAVNHLNDRVAADVHVLLTSNRNASQGRTFQTIFYGQNRFDHMTDTIRFFIGPNATDFDRREAMAKHIKIGLIPFLIENNNFENIDVSMTKLDAAGEEQIRKDDRWNYWVFRVRGSAEIDGDENSQDYEFELGAGGSRITEKRKLDFWYQEELERSDWTYYDDEDSVEKSDSFTNISRRFFHSNIFAINQHWSYGYGMSYVNNTFSNYKLNLEVAPAVEYSFYPYDEFNNRLVTLRYFLGLNQLIYNDTTIYGQTRELLPFHEVQFNISLNQKWGNIFLGSRYKSYLHDVQFYSLDIFSNIEVQLTGALSIDIRFGGGLSHDQINLAGEGKSLDEVLSQRREILSSFNFRSDIGISYRFGSQFANFVNPRFDD